MSNPLLKALTELTGNRNVLTVHKSVVEFTGSLEAAIFLEQLLYWTPRATLTENWIAKSDKEFSEELCISRYAVKKARKTCLEMGIIQTELRQFGGTPMIHYHVSKKKLGEAWSDYLEPKSPLDETEQSEKRNEKDHLSKSDNPNDETAKSITETTAKTTSKPTQKSAAVAAARNVANPDFALVKAMLAKEEIGEPTRSELAAMPKLSERLFLQVRNAWKLKGGRQGLLVIMLRDAGPLLTEEEENRKYISGEYSHLIEH